MAKQDSLEKRFDDKPKERNNYRRMSFFRFAAVPFLAAVMSLTSCVKNEPYQQLTYTESAELTPDVKNEKVVFSRKSLGTGESQIHVIDEKGSEKQLTNISGFNIHPVFSSDGKHIYFFNISSTYEPNDEHKNKLVKEEYKLLKIPSSGESYTRKDAEIVKSHDFNIPYSIKEFEGLDFQKFYFTQKGRKITAKPSDEKGTIYIDGKQVSGSVGTYPSLSLDERILITTNEGSLYRQNLGNKPSQITRDSEYSCPNYINKGIYRGNLLAVKSDKEKYYFVLLDENGKVLSEKETHFRFLGEAVISENGKEVFYVGNRDLYKSRLENLFGGKK